MSTPEQQRGERKKLGGGEVLEGAKTINWAQELEDSNEAEENEKGNKTKGSPKKGFAGGKGGGAKKK